MKTTVELTREAGGFDATPEFLERLVALVRADERERAQRENAYVALEREACAQVAENCFEGVGKHKPIIMAVEAAKAIRARGNT